LGEIATTVCVNDGLGKVKTAVGCRTLFGFEKGCGFRFNLTEINTTTQTWFTLNPTETKSNGSWLVEPPTYTRDRFPDREV